MHYPARSSSGGLHSCVTRCYKAHDWTTGLTGTLLLSQALNNLHPKLPLTAVSHIPIIPVIAPTHLAPKCTCVCALLFIMPNPHSEPTAFTLLLHLQNLFSYSRVGTGESGKSCSISPQFPAEDAIAPTWYFNIGKCWKCIPKTQKISNIPPAKNLLLTLPCCFPSLKQVPP